MQVTEQDLRERYEALETEQLIGLQTKGGLTEAATRVLEQVLAERSVSTNERVAIASDVKKRVAADEAMMAALASRDARLAAQLIDLVVVVAIVLVAFLLGIVVAEPLAYLGFILAVAYLLFADGLPRGQSVGKRLVGIAVVDRRTKRPCSWAESLVRNLPLMLLGILDWLFIFGRTRQRLGDMMASTIVVRVNYREIAGLDW